MGFNFPKKINSLYSLDGTPAVIKFEPFGRRDSKTPLDTPLDIPHSGISSVGFKNPERISQEEQPPCSFHYH